MASQKNKTEVMSLAIKNGADVNKKDTEGNTLLYLAMHNQDSQAGVGAANFLCSPPRFYLNAKDHYNRPILYYAIHHFQSLNQRDESDKTIPIRRQNCLDIVVQLVKNPKIELNEKIDGKTLLEFAVHVAIRNKDTALLETMLEAVTSDPTRHQDICKKMLKNVEKKRSKIGDSHFDNIKAIENFIIQQIGFNGDQKTTPPFSNLRL